jgi:hypothetical protein
MNADLASQYTGQRGRGAAEDERKRDERAVWCIPPQPCGKNGDEAGPKGREQDEQSQFRARGFRCAPRKRWVTGRGGLELLQLGIARIGPDPGIRRFVDRRHLRT